MPVTCLVPWPGVPQGCSADVTAFQTPPPDAVHADGEQWLRGRLIDQADHDELVSGPRRFALSQAGLNTIDIRIFNLGTASVPGLVTLTLVGPDGVVLDGPVPCAAPIPPSDHLLVTAVATVVAPQASPVVVIAAAPPRRGKKKKGKGK